MRTKFERTRSACITLPLHQKCGGAFLQMSTASAGAERNPVSPTIFSQENGLRMRTKFERTASADEGNPVTPTNLAKLYASAILTPSAVALGIADQKPSVNLSSMLIKAQSPSAAEALELVAKLQARFVEGLERVSSACGQNVGFEESEWLRDTGQHGGGNRYTVSESDLFNRASVNVSQVHYDDLPEKKLGSATAISTIIHPQNPHAPSVHIHISWTEMKAVGDAPDQWVLADHGRS